MKARAVIGSNFGDEGKGLMVDYLSATQGAGMIVRYNGGAQAGHTVVSPEGWRHVFQHFGSGTFHNIPTFLSQFFVCNPIMFDKELKELNKLNFYPDVYAHPDCLVTTFADMMINQMIEDKRGAKRHGSVGLGFNETFERSQLPELSITMGDLWNDVDITPQLKEICGKYAEFRTGAPIKEAGMIDAFVKMCKAFAEYVNPLGIADCENPIFEGSQGLLLDMDNVAYQPHVTRSNTGMKNIRTLCAQAGIDDIETYYVSRTYLTRHGAGKLPNEDPSLTYFDDTNLPHPYQGTIRFAPIDGDLVSRCTQDMGSDNYKVVLTHCDQREPEYAVDLYSYGPTRWDIN